MKTDTTLLERLVQQVLEAGLATGHADTPEELMAEVLGQVKRLRTDHDRPKTENRQLREMLYRSDEKLSEVGDFIRDMVSRMDDEGDRVYLGSTNDADRLRELAAWFQGRMYRKALRSTESNTND